MGNGGVGGQVQHWSVIQRTDALLLVPGWEQEEEAVGGSKDRWPDARH